MEIEHLALALEVPIGRVVAEIFGDSVKLEIFSERHGTSYLIINDVESLGFEKDLAKS